MRASDAERAVADLAAAQHGVITRSQAASIGLSSAVLRRRVNAGLWVPAAPNVFVAASAQPSWEQQAAIATLAGPGVVLSHRAAARLHRLDGFRDAPVEVSVLRGRRYRALEITAHHVAALHRVDTTEIGAIQVTTVERTLCDLGSVVGADRLEQALDSALRRGVAPARLTRVAQRLHRPGQRGTKLLLSLLDDPNRRGRVSDSWFERIVERIVRHPGLPEVVRQHVIYDDDGEFVARVDVAIPSVKLAIECHSREFHFGPRRERLDQMREHRMIAEGWLTLYLGYADTRRPGQVLKVVSDAVSARTVTSERR